MEKERSKEGGERGKVQDTPTHKNTQQNVNNFDPDCSIYIYRCIFLTISPQVQSIYTVNKTWNIFGHTYVLNRCRE